jgi:predicted nuclease of predicted toxin-antitoxin system
MSLKFFTDTHIAKQIAVQLDALGIDIVRCQDLGLEDASDQELLEYAVTHERAMLTKDDDFLTMHSNWQNTGRDHFGIFYCPYRDRSVIGLIVKVCKEYHDLIESGAGEEADIKNEVVYIT